MTLLVPVYANFGKDRFMQKCLIPPNLLKSLKITVGDYVVIQALNLKFICRIHSTVLPYNSIYVDTILTSESFYLNHPDSYCALVKVPDDIIAIESSSFEHIRVKVIYSNDAYVTYCEKVIYEDVVSKIMKGYMFQKDFVVNCNGLKIADIFHIHSILVSETFPEISQYGKLKKTSKIEIIDLISVEHIWQLKKYQCLQLGGISDTLNVLKSYLCVSSAKVLISGPPGSGKSSLVKKFFSSTKCFFVIIDGLKNLGIITKKCSDIYNQFVNYLKIFPNHVCVLFIDHVDVIAPNSFKDKTTLISSIVNLVNSVSNLNVSVIAATNNRKNMNHKLSSLFVKEVTLGIPSFQQRKEMLISLAEQLDCDVDFDKVAQITPGFVAHDISLLFQEALKNSKSTEVLESQKSGLKCLTTEDFLRGASNISPSVLKTSVWNMKVKPVHWKDIGGMFGIKRRLQMCIEWPLHNPDIFKKVDLPCPRGVLLFGPPGCCKTTLARGLATECNANFFSATPAQIYSPYVGESEKNITELFYHARLSAPSIIFLDEIDSLVSQRKLDKKSQGIGEKVLSALLNEMDGFGTKVQYQSSLGMQKLLNDDDIIRNLSDKIDVEQHFGDDVIVVAATNRPDLIDDALLRPGRFDIILYVPPPNEEERESILQTLTEHKPIQNVNMKYIAEKTKLFSGADLKLLCNEAAMNALRHDMSALSISEENFLEALAKIQPSITKQQIDMYEKLSSKYGTFIK